MSTEKVGLIHKKSEAAKLLDVLSDFEHNYSHYLLGRILTIIDACIFDQSQRKAIKDLIEEAFWSNNNYRSRNVILGQFFEKYAPELKKEEESNFWENKGNIEQNYFPEN